MANNPCRFLHLKISAETAGQRLDQALTELKEIPSRSKAAELISREKVTSTSKKKLKPSFKVSLNEEYTVEISENISESKLQPYDFPLNVVYEDEDVIVIDKPAGLVVHPSPGHYQDTLVNALVYHNKNLSTGSASGRPGIVHRLDKDTSGLIVVAKNDQAHTLLAKQFFDKSAHRLYWALAFGPFKNSSGTIKSQLGRHPIHRKKIASLQGERDGEPLGKNAVTHYSLLQSHSSGIHLVQCELETGRTHQIRVHLSEGHNPILGDELYGGVHRAKNLKNINLRVAIKDLNRVALHAKKLTFLHPTTNKVMTFEVPIPKDLKILFDLLGFHVS